MPSMPLVGEYEVTLGEDNSVVLPVDIRRQLTAMGETSLIACVGSNHALWLYPPRYYLIAANQNGLSETNLPKTDAAVPIALGAGGRLRLSRTYRVDCRFERDLTVLGANDHLELWNRSTWETYRRQLLS